MLENILNPIESTRTTESHVYEVFITKRDGTGTPSIVSGAHSFTKRAGAPSPHTFTWLSGRILSASTLGRSESSQTTGTWLLIMALPAWSKSGRLRSTVFRPQTLRTHRWFKQP